MSTLHLPETIFLFVLAVIVLLVAVIVIQATVISIIHYEDRSVEERLSQLKLNKRFSEQNQNTDPFMMTMAMLHKLAMPVSKALYSDRGASEKIRQLLSEAGLPDTEKQLDYYRLQRASVGIVTGLLGGCCVILLMQPVSYILCGILGGYVLGSMVPQVQLKMKASQRKAEVLYKLPDALDLMIMCVEAGLGMDTTFQRTSEEIQLLAPDIAYEFRRLSKELNAGINRSQALQNLGKRSGVNELRSLCAMIIQADKMGTSIADTLRSYAQDMRRKRRQRAEELASKASIKMIFPLVFFIFPPLFIVLLAPTIIQALLTLKPSS
jgi:tight adherence protein C